MIAVPTARLRLLGAGTLLLASTLFSGGALAHNPMCECKQIDGEQIRCTGGFSDGSGAPGVTLDVIGYDETILVPGKLGADSTLTFKKPDAEFYVLFDAGPGHVVEIDQADIEAP
ncbi:MULTISPECIES: hypothetical protein [Pseudomonas]|uniref:Secreted protein n=1 Tax=Pseudomonas chlororaphis TaxID=587753 RepID=A0AAX3FTG1_9PSED|nr:MULTISPECIES: hypothetical protein [Pseudomonas]AVO60288.1 hypothetical protein C6Q18_20825 [Pseudomonas chlororaphis subsp. piscium]AZC38875.1 hypothetical protein C4K37_4502 [Pseudomonas chlororaphis subsp. piscium]AZC45425.1 hypothetical protein C4K36_4514 [Pseudomonas chlororaphis subsp. piscium]AZC52083.1 hypothetical protein C4K35_4514 [Pseudomonas chlororaphis subsp. piscium]AZC58525.1 hypothetical protein C4K34_4374 [Pseudomonas chlororaphis subsp. piscium]